MKLSVTLQGQTLTFEGEVSFEQVMEIFRAFLSAVEPSGELEELVNKLRQSREGLQEAINGSGS